MERLPTIEDFDLTNKRILLRVDINSPIDPFTLKILDDFRIKAYKDTISKLNDSKIIIIAHQGRPGLYDFTSLKSHAEKLSEVLNREVKFIDEIIGSRVKEEIEKMQNGDIILLENVRFLSEEVSEEITKRPYKEQANTIFVKKLSSYVDFYVNDAFACSHRSQPSIVGFPYVLDSAIGLIFKREIENLSKAIEFNDKPRVYIFGGAKLKDSIKTMKSLLEKNRADYILTTGMVGVLFLYLDGIDIGQENKKVLEKEKEYVEIARKLYEKFKDKIVKPVDVAIEKDGKRIDTGIKNINGRIYDIGLETIVNFSSYIKNAKLVVANGPAGMYEIPEFSIGTKELIRSISKSNGFKIIGGGHLVTVARMLKLEHKIDFISTAGKAMLLFLTGEKLPGIESIKESYKLKGKKL